MITALACRRAARLVTVAAAALLISCGAPRRPSVPPIAMPSEHRDHVDVRGALLSASPYLDSEQARAAFGFDIRGAGLLPVRFALDNRSGAVIRIKPDQTFLIDNDGQAWPVLTAEQAYNRVNRALEQGDMSIGQNQAARMLNSAVSTTGFALGMLLGRGVAGPAISCWAVGSGGGINWMDDCNRFQEEIRKELSAKTLHAQRVQPGDLAYGVLFFPGRDEARSARSLRIALELDGYPEVVNLPLQ